MILYAAGALARRRALPHRSARARPGSSATPRHRRSAPNSASRVVLSPAAPMPLAWGILRPVIVLPAAAPSWPAARLRAVLLHESMHHRRRDLLTQAIAQAACCLYWCHPLAWLALARQRVERERACDDAVLAARRARPRLRHAPHRCRARRRRVAPSAGPTRPPWPTRPASKRASAPSWTATPTARPLTRAAAFAVAAAAMLSCSRPRPSSTSAPRTPAARSPASSRIPAAPSCPTARSRAKNLDGSNEEVTRANPAGEYRAHRHSRRPLRAGVRAARLRPARN